MKTISPQLLEDLRAGFAAAVLQIDRADGVSLYYTDRDAPLSIDGAQYVPAPGVAGIKVRLTNNAQVSSQSVRAAWVPALAESDILAGLYDLAQIRLGLASSKTPAAGVLWLFAGTLGTVQHTADGFEAQAMSLLYNLQKPIGIFATPNCRHALFSTQDAQGVGGCMLSAAAYTYAGTITGLNNAMSWQVEIANYGAAATPNTPNAPALTVTQNVAGQYLPPGEYRYSVSAIDSRGQESSPSPISSCVVLPNNGESGGGTVALSWQAVPGAASYNIYGNSVQQLLYNTTATTWTDNGSSGTAGGLAPLHGDYFAGGIVTMITGAAAGLTANVLTTDGNTLQLLLPLGRRPAVGDHFTVTPGCSKSAATCQYKFQNIANFGGFPDLTPQREWM